MVLFSFYLGLYGSTLNAYIYGNQHAQRTLEAHGWTAPPHGFWCPLLQMRYEASFSIPVSEIGPLTSRP
jgi:hypothetical protein